MEYKECVCENIIFPCKYHGNQHMKALKKGGLIGFFLAIIMQLLIYIIL